MEKQLGSCLFFLTSSILTEQTTWDATVTLAQLNSVFKHSGESSNARSQFPSVQKAATEACSGGYLNQTIRFVGLAEGSQSGADNRYL